jgi:hypothetical protein
MISGASTAGSTFPTEPQVTNRLRRHLSLTSSLLRVGKNPIHGGYGDPYPLGDFSPLQPFGIQLDDLGGLGACRRIPPMTWPTGLAVDLSDAVSPTELHVAAQSRILRGLTHANA